MFKEKLMGNLKKKGAKELDPNEKKAKMDVVKSLSSQAGAMMGSKMKGFGGLKQGVAESDSKLEHTGDVADHTGSPYEGKPGDGDSSPDSSSGAEGAEEDFAEEHADCSPEELDQKIQALMDLKAKKESGQE